MLFFLLLKRAAVFTGLLLMLGVTWNGAAHAQEARLFLHPLFTDNMVL